MWCLTAKDSGGNTLTQEFDDLETATHAADALRLMGYSRVDICPV